MPCKGKILLTEKFNQINSFCKWGFAQSRHGRTWMGNITPCRPSQLVGSVVKWYHSLPSVEEVLECINAFNTWSISPLLNQFFT